MKWTERELQNYRNAICNDTMQQVTDCHNCTKTKEEIDECFMNLYYDVSDEDELWDNEEQVCN